MYNLNFYKELFSLHFGELSLHINNVKYFYPIYEAIAENAFEVFLLETEYNETNKFPRFTEEFKKELINVISDFYFYETHEQLLEKCKKSIFLSIKTLQKDILDSFYNYEKITIDEIIYGVRLPIYPFTYNLENIKDSQFGYYGAMSFSTYKKLNHLFTVKIIEDYISSISPQ